MLQRTDTYPVPTGAPPIPGLEVAGGIVALGVGVAGWSVGDGVCTLTSGDGYAQYATAPAVQLLRWSTGYNATLAICLPEAYFTVWANLFQIDRLRAGEIVLVHGGRGDVGMTATQLARAFGARVFATSGSDEGCRDCTMPSADPAINVRRKDFAHAVARATTGKGVDVVLDNYRWSLVHTPLGLPRQWWQTGTAWLSGRWGAERVDLLPILARRFRDAPANLRPMSRS